MVLMNAEFKNVALMVGNVYLPGIGPVRDDIKVFLEV